MELNNMRPPISPRLNVLTEEQIESIHQASLEVLEKTGYHVPVEEAKEIYIAAGARSEGERVYIPQELVEGARRTIKPVQLYDRSGNPSSVLKAKNVVFGALCDTPHILDPIKRDVRSYVKDDQSVVASLLDALPNIDYIECVGQSADVPDELQTQVAVAQSLRYTSKPIQFFAYDRQGMLDILEVAYTVAGSQASFRQKPFLISTSVPAAPLYGTDYNLELLMTSAELQVPLLYYSCPAIGGNSPSSLVGTLILANADWLAALVLHQLKRPGAPFCTAGFTIQLMDMKTTLWAYCAPEALLAQAAIADIAHWYGMPAWGLEAIADTPQLDMQAGFEMVSSCNWAIQVGLEVVHNAGLMGSGKLLTTESLIYIDEIIAHTRHATKNFPTAPGEISEVIDLINELGPMGEYLSHEHTYNHFRDFWYPTLLTRMKFDPISDDVGPSLIDRLNERARHLINTHEPDPLPEDVLGEIKALEASWYRRLR